MTRPGGVLLEWVIVIMIMTVVGVGVISFQGVLQRLRAQVSSLVVFQKLQAMRALSVSLKEDSSCDIQEQALVCSVGYKVYETHMSNSIVLTRTRKVGFTPVGHTKFSGTIVFDDFYRVSVGVGYGQVGYKP